MPSVTDTAKPYNLEVARRQPLTEQNLQELCLDTFLQHYLDNPNSLDRDSLQKFEALVVAYDKENKPVKPTGFSINEMRFGTFPKTESAAKRGWITYMNLGEPLIEERDNIKPPAPDTLSSRVYVNRSNTECQFEDTVEFTVENTTNWSIEGTVQLTFGALAAAEIQAMAQTENTLHQQTTMHSHPNDTGSETENAMDQTSTTQGTATGRGELSAQLMLGITASASGSLTTSWTSTSTISGGVPPNSRVTTRATQRRMKRKYVYQIPVSFAGHIAASYDKEVQIKDTTAQSNGNKPLAKVIALKIEADNPFNATGKPFRSITLDGEAEDVSTLAVEHTVFAMEKLVDDEQLLHKKPAAVATATASAE